MSNPTQIIKSFLKDSPPGEFNNVLKDCRELVQNDDIFQECLPQCLHEYNTEQLTVVMDGTDPVIISKYTEQSENEYIDPINQKIVTFDHLSKQITSSQPLSNKLPGNENIKNSLQKKLNDYAKEFYPKGAAIVMPVDEKTFKLIISAADFKPQQFSNGKWRSEWTITCGGKINVEGRIRVEVHYFEDANIQMHTDTKKKFTCNSGSDDQVAQNVLREIRTIEDGFHAELDKIFATLSDNCLKALRRQLPISRQKINWFNWRGHKMMK